MADDNLLDGGQRSDEQHEDEQRAAEPPRGLLLIGGIDCASNVLNDAGRGWGPLPG